MEIPKRAKLPGEVNWPSGLARREREERERAHAAADGPARRERERETGKRNYVSDLF